MRPQLQKRLPKSFVEEILEAFHDHRILEEIAFYNFQRRISYLGERYKVRDIREALKIVGEVSHFYNEQRVHQETEQVPRKRWEEALKAGKGRLRPLEPGIDLDLVFSLPYERTVKKDGSFSFQGKEYRLRNLAGMRAIVGVIPAQKLMVIKDGQKMAEFLF